METYITLYEYCYDILYMVSSDIIDTHKNKKSKIILELLDFLLTDHSRFENVLKENSNIGEDKKFCKNIMMLIIVSSSYLLSLYQANHEINVEANLQIIDEIKKLSPQEIITAFKNFKDNSYIIDYIDDFFSYSGKNYIFRNGCLETVLQEDKLSELLQINPFEIINFLDYIPPEKFLTTEKFIQGFIDIYDSSICHSIDILKSFKDDEYDDTVVEIFKEKVNEYFGDNEEQILKFYSYIFSNVYETLVVLVEKDKLLYDTHQDLIGLFSDCNYNFENLYEMFVNNTDIAILIIEFFVYTNDDILEETLIDKREDYIEVGDVEILRKLNPYYDEENMVYEKIKKMSKEYHD